MDFLGYSASIAMGITLGLMGSGGSILTVPILVYLFGLPPSVATGYSLFVVGATALIGGILALRRKELDFRAVLAFALPSAIGVNISRGLLLPQIPPKVAQLGTFTLTKETLVMVAFAGLMILASLSMIQIRKEEKPTTSSPTSSAVLIGLQGLVVGMIAGFVGAGGGFLVVPVLIFMAGLRMKVAVGTSLTIVALQSLVGFTGDVSRGFQVDWFLLSFVTAAAILGIFVGSALTRKVQEQKLKIAFGWFVLLMGTTILGEQFFRISSR